jgi:hypothetical protein
VPAEQLRRPLLVMGVTPSPPATPSAAHAVTAVDTRACVDGVCAPSVVGGRGGLHVMGGGFCSARGVGQERAVLLRCHVPPPMPCQGDCCPPAPLCFWFLSPPGSTPANCVCVRVYRVTVARVCEWRVRGSPPLVRNHTHGGSPLLGSPPGVLVKPWSNPSVGPAQRWNVGRGPPTANCSCSWR